MGKVIAIVECRRQCWQCEVDKRATYSIEASSNPGTDMGAVRRQALKAQREIMEDNHKKHEHPDPKDMIFNWREYPQK